MQFIPEIRKNLFIHIEQAANNYNSKLQKIEIKQQINYNYYK